MKLNKKKIFFTIIFFISFFPIKKVISTIKDSKLALNYMTHQMCGCLFTMHQNEDFCKKYIKNEYLSPTIKIDYQNKKIQASLYSLIHSNIYYTEKKFGCSFAKKEKRL